MRLTDQERADSLRKEAERLIREKSPLSTFTERHFLADGARRATEGLPQPIRQGRGLRYILDRASLPVDERDFLLGRYIDKVPTGPEEMLFSEIFRNRSPWDNPVLCLNAGHITLDFETLVSEGIVGYIVFQCSSQQ